MSLVSRSIIEGDRFACGFIKPQLENCGIGVWAIERGILDGMRGNEKDDIRKMIMELAGKENLEIWCISQRNEKKLV